MTRQRVLRAVAMACLLGAGVLVSPLVAGADEPVEIGWWSRENGGNPVGPPITVPRPPDVPEGGLLVAQDVGGPSAISALRFQANVQTTSTLTLSVADSIPAVNPPQILACPPTSGWGATDHGEWFTAPDADCDAASALGEVAEGSITWSLPPAFKRGERPYIEVMLVPGDDPAPFRVPFNAPGADALTAPVDLTGPTTTTFVSPPPTVAPPPPVAPVERQFGGAQVAAVSAPVSTSSTTPPAPVSPSPSPGEVASPPVTPASATDTTGQRVLAAALLGVLGIILLTASTERERMVALLARVPGGGRLAGDVGDGPDGSSERVGGVGRFSRPRDDLPTRL